MTGNVDLDTLRDRKFTTSNDNLAITIKPSVIKSDLSSEFVAQLPATTCSFFPTKQPS